MNWLLVVLRLIHIIGGVFWVGAALLMNFFIAPSMRATGDAGKQFIGHLVAKTRFSLVMSISAYATIIAGFLLYGLDSQWFTSGWLASSTAAGFGVGAVFALVGLVSGLINGANNKKLGQLGAQIQGKPTTEQAAALSAISKQQAWVLPVNSWSLLLALFFMAIARYLVF
jgi:uncharacterized membrane protein